MYLGIDLGTGTLKAAIFDDRGALITASEEPYAASVPATGVAEFDPTDWWEVARRVVRSVTESHGRDVTAVGLGGQMHGVVLIDREGRHVRPAVLWPDHRATTVLDRFSRFDHDHPGVLGNPLVPGMAGPILAWLAEHEPDSVRNADAVVQPKDWLRMKLTRTGAATDPSDASATLLYDVSSDSWSDELSDVVPMRHDQLPPIVDSDAVVGFLDDTVAEELNLQRIPVVAGAGDAAAALLGAGIEEPGTALVNIGTGGQIMTPIPGPAGGKGLGPGLHQYRSASNATAWYAMAAIANAGLALDWVRTMAGYSWDQLYETAAGVFLSPDQDPTFMPFLTNERHPSHDAPTGAAWTGLGLEHDAEALVRSALRGVALYLGHRARALMELANASVAVMSGGSARHDEWVVVLATILGRDIAVSPDMHLTVRGAARLAARATGADFIDPPPGRLVSPRTDVDVESLLRSFEDAVNHHFSTSA